LKRVILALALAFYAVGMPRPTAAAVDYLSDDPVLARIEPAVHRLANRMPGLVAVSIANLRDGTGFSINGDSNMPAASVIKIPVMVEVFHQIAIGKFTLQRTVMVLDRDRDCGYGALCDVAWGKRYTVQELLWRMITRSDNTATNMLVRLVGRSNINQTMEDLGLTQTHLGDIIHSDGDVRALRTSANDMTHLLAELAGRHVISDEADNLMLQILAGQRHNTLLPQPLPKSLVVAHKTGTLHDTLNDVGIVELPGSPYVICVLTTHLGDLDYGESFIRKVSRLTYDAFRLDAEGM
jgi:beta-lactamase class A